MAKYRISKAVGIDLGTTNSVVAILNPTDSDIIVHRDKKSETTPSCVWKDSKTGEIVVGRKAYARLGNPPEPIRSIKRLMGRQTQVRVTNEDMSPEMISSFILKEMKRQIEEDVAHFATDSVEYVVDRAIVTVPAYFDQPQIEATRKAAEMAGLQVLELLHEPTAAACYHCWETNTQNGTFLVYDLGGGTFDVSIVRCTEGEFEVLSISGNNHLGGDDFDALLAEELATRLTQEYDLTLDYTNEEDKLRFTKLKLLAEGAKIALSNVDDYMLRDPSTLQDKSGERVLIEMPFERQELEQLIKSDVERTVPYCFEALDKASKKANVTLADIDHIILAGGSTHIPMIREMVQKTFCADSSIHEPRAKCTEPIYKKVDTAVGLGAAIRAAATGGVVVYNPENTVRVTFRGIGAVEGKQTYIGGIVETLTPTISLSQGTIKLTVPHMSYEDEQDIKDNGAFSFTRIPLQVSIDNLLIFEICDRQGIAVATVERHIRQSKETLRPTGGSTGTATLAKSIIMDVVHLDGSSKSNDAGKRVLFQAGTTLPVHFQETFYYRGDVDYIRIPVYQNATMIREIIVDIKVPLPKGTEIPLSVEVDKLSNIIVKGKAGGTLFEVEIVPALPRPLPTEEEVQSLKKTFTTALAVLSTEKRSSTVEQYRRIMQSYEGAVRRKDNEKVVHEYEEILTLISSISQHSTSLQPSKRDFDELVDLCSSLNRNVFQVSDDLDQPHDYKKMAQVIKTQQEEGENAFANEDQSAYTDAVEMLESIRDHLYMLIREVHQSQDTRTKAQKANDAIEYLIQEVTTLETQAISNVEVRSQLKQLKHGLEKALEDVDNDIQTDGTTRIAFQEINRLKMLLNISDSQENMNTKGLLGERK